MHAAIKRFTEWFKLKELLHNKKHRAPLVSEGDIWWASLGENIGSEINGKSEHFTRPAVILKKLSHNFYLIAPVTTQKQSGSWYVHVRHADTDEYICLHQIRSIDYRRIYSKLGQIDDADFQKVKEGFLKLYK